MDTTGTMNLSWADILPRGNERMESSTANRPTQRLKIWAERKRKWEQEERDMMKPQHCRMEAGTVVDIFGLAAHFGCGAAEAVRRARGWPTWVSGVDYRPKNGKSRLLAVQVWRVPG